MHLALPLSEPPVFTASLAVHRVCLAVAAGRPALLRPDLHSFPSFHLCMSLPTSRPISYWKSPRLLREPHSEQPSAWVKTTDSKMILHRTTRLVPRRELTFVAESMGLSSFFILDAISHLCSLWFINLTCFDYFPFFFLNISSFCFAHVVLAVLLFFFTWNLGLNGGFQNYLAQADYGS
jgi:hypothetical protein